MGGAVYLYDVQPPSWGGVDPFPSVVRAVGGVVSGGMRWCASHTSTEHGIRDFTCRRWLGAWRNAKNIITDRGD